MDFTIYFNNGGKSTKAFPLISSILPFEKQIGAFYIKYGLFLGRSFKITCLPTCEHFHVLMINGVIAFLSDTMWFHSLVFQSRPTVRLLWALPQYGLQEVHRRVAGLRETRALPRDEGGADLQMWVLSLRRIESSENNNFSLLWPYLPIKLYLHVSGCCYASHVVRRL